MSLSHLIIGGAGFIGSNIAKNLITENQKVTILDNLSRKGSEKNISWLEKKYPKKFTFINADITKDLEALNSAIKNTDRIYHMAAQVAVTTSVQEPKKDFEINALGTFNVLEAMRLYGKPDSMLLYASTNKVYGGMEDLKIIETETGYLYKDFPNGISESRSLDFHSPYGCSKGAGDQYVRDYARIYDLNTVVFRQSCIYGPRQFGVEDQGWIAWFIIATLTGRSITIYGNGKQVRDILYIDDLVNAYKLAFDNIEVTKGEIFNIGGGPKNVISIWNDFKAILEKLHGKKINVSYDKWRPGDQKIYVSDISKASKTFGWKPETSAEKGIAKLYDWAKRNINLFKVLI